MKRILGLALAPLALFALIPSAEADTRPRIVLNFGSPIALECKNPGSHQDVAKTPVLTNTTGAALKAGQSVFWKSSDGDNGSMKLAADLAPGASVQATGKAGQGYTCTANFYSSPDLIVSKALMNSNGTATIEVSNLDPWVDAGPATTKVEVFSCSGSLLSSTLSQPMSVGKGGKATFSVPAQAVGRSYLRVTADAGYKVFEKKENNNVWDAQGTCIR